MGNQRIKESMESVLDKGFELDSINQLRDVYLPASFKGIDESNAKAFLSLINKMEFIPSPDEARSLSSAMRNCFPFNSSMDFDGTEPREVLWNQTARNIWQTGYNQWQHNLAMLQGDSFKNVVLSQNAEASRYEFLFFTRSMMLCSNFMLRHQGGSEVKDVMTYFRETFDQSSNDYGFVTTAQTIFLSMVSGVVQEQLQHPENLSNAIDSLILATKSLPEGSLFSREAQGMQFDLVLKKVRLVLLRVLQSADAPEDLIAKCVSLLFRIGVASGNSEDLILAAHFQFIFKIDISSQCEYFLKQSEVFEEPKSAEEADENADQFVNTEKKRIQNKCDYNGNGSNRQHAHDKMCCDGQAYYSFCSERGLSRATKNDKAEWEHAKTNGSDEAKRLKKPTFLVHGENLYIRHEDAADVPFQLLNKTEMTIVADQAPITPPPGEENRFKWTTANDPPIVKEGFGKRWMRQAPMCSDGKFIYTIVQYREDGQDSPRKAIFCEVYQLSENVITFVEDIELFEGSNVGWNPKPNHSEEGGYFDFGLLTCNGKHLVWSSSRNFHIFNLKTGERIKKKNVHSGKHLTMYDSLSSNFYTCDADCYSWLDEWKIKGFKTIIQVDDEEGEAESKLPTIPVILDDVKSKIKKNVVKKKQPDFQLNLFQQIVGGQMEVDARNESQKFYASERQKFEQEIADKQAEAGGDEENKVEDLKEDGWIFDQTRAIILAHISKLAQEKNFYARAQNKQLDGKDMIKFFKDKFSISVSESMFSTLRMSLQKVLEEFDMHSSDISERFTLKSLLHIYIAHIGCLRPLKISIRQFMSTEEMEEQKKLLETLGQIKLFPGQQKNPPENIELPENECFQLHIYHLAQQVINEMENLISTQTIAEKLDDMQTKMNNFKDVENDVEIIKILKRYHAAEFSEIFDQDEDVLEKIQNIFQTVLDLIFDRLSVKAQQMFNDKTRIDDDFQGFGSEETLRMIEFTYNFLQELMITFGSQKKAIVENQPNKEAGEEQAQQEAKKARNLAQAQASLEKLNDLLYNVMIEACKSLKKMLKQFAQHLLSSEFKDYEDDDYARLFGKLDSLITGKSSLLRAIQMFVMTIQLYEVGSTDLDEVSEALREAMEGLRFYTAASTTLHRFNDRVVQFNKDLQRELVDSQRFISFALSKVACRLINGASENSEVNYLAKFQILRNGIAEKFIPRLSDNCKKEIEGSFKITKDEDLRKSTLQPATAVVLSDNDALLVKIMNKDGDDIAKLVQMLTEANAVEGQKPNDPIVEDLIRQTFATMICFQELFDALNAALCAEQIEQVPKSIQNAWQMANKMRAWEHKTFDELQQKLRPTVTEEFKKEYHEENPSKPQLEGKLSEEHQATVDDRVQKKAKEELKQIFSEAQKKCEFLLMFETNDVAPKIEATDVDVFDQRQYWTGWDPQHSATAKTNRVKNTEDVERETFLQIQTELLDIIQTREANAKQLQEFTELGQINGLRRLAGLVTINKTLSSNDGEIFYDALHVLESSLRGNKAQLNHYLDGVPGCGARTEREIRAKFFQSIHLIVEKIQDERDPQKLVLLLNALLWEYNAEDMQVLAQAKVFQALSGDEEHSYMLFNTIYNAWGKEQSYFSVEKREQSSTQTNEYSLSARLRQCFDYLALTVFRVIFSEDQKYQTNTTLNKICSSLMQQIQNICFKKLERHLSMLQIDVQRAQKERDEDIRFDTQAGEKVDNQEEYMVDQCLAYGEDCIDKAKTEYETKHDARLLVVEKFIKQYENEDKAQVVFMEASMQQEGMQLFDLQTTDEFDEALLSREWRIIKWASKADNAQIIAITLGDEKELAEEEEEKKKADEGADLTEMKAEVSKKANEKDKIEEWIRQIQAQEGKENPLTNATFFSRVSLIRLLRHIILLISLAESSREGGQLVLKVLSPLRLTTLFRLSALGSSQIQCLIQKIFQSLLRCNIKLNFLNQAVNQAMADDSTNRVAELSKKQFPNIDMKSSFWTFQLNQIYLSRRAQFSTTDQVEVGKAAVVEEVVRTFLVQQTKEGGEHVDVIREQIMKSLKNIDQRTDIEIATLFSLVPESHSPIICTGKRCRDEESGVHFICLGFAQVDKTHLYETKLSLVQCKNSQVAGIIINKGSQQMQVQKNFSYSNVTAVPDVDVSEQIQGEATPQAIKSRIKEMTKNISIYMNPEIVSQLLSRMTSKDSIMRSNPEKAITQQFLQIFVLNGIFRMLEIFEKDYLIVLKSYNQLENLINFLSKEAAEQKIKPDEPLVSSSLLMQQASEVFMSATHTSRSTGYYAKFFIYIEEESKHGAMLQRLTDDSNLTEFMDINVVASYGDNNREPIKCEEQHEVSNVYGGGENEAIINCMKCKQSINSIQKASQKKTGYMRCLECTSDVFFCNECNPMPQIKHGVGLDVGISTLSVFRIARHEAIFIKSTDLLTMTEQMLFLMLSTNVIIIEKNPNATLLQILEALAAKTQQDNKWKACATCRFIVVEEADFTRACAFIRGEKINQNDQSRGRLLTKICGKVDIAQKRINNASTTHAFVTKFLQEMSQPYNDFLNQTVPNILIEEIGKDHGEEVKERQREEKKMTDQLKTINEPVQLEIQENIRSMQRSVVNTSGEKTPDFMQKFTAESDKLIQEGGKEFFNPAKISIEQSEYRNRFDEIVFESDNRNPGQLQRKQLKSCISKVNQIMARQIWLRLMSEVTEGIDEDTKNIINATAMHQKICDLIHDCNMSASYQMIFFGDTYQQKIVRNQITKLLTYFDSQPEGNKFVSFFVKDFLKRADMTIDQVRKDNYTELSSYKLKDLRKVSKLQNVFDPNNLLFLSRQIFKLEHFLTGNIKTEMAKVLFDLHLGFAILFKSEQDALISQELVKGCSWALDQLIENIDTFVSNPQTVNGLLRSDMIVELFKFMDQNDQNTNKKKLINEIIIKLDKIYNYTKKRNPDNSPTETPYVVNDKIKALLNGYSALEHGKKFSSMLPRIKLLALLRNQKLSNLVSQYGRTYMTQKRMFKTFYKNTFTPTQAIDIIIDHTTTKQSIQVQKTQDKKSIIVDANAFALGNPNSLRVEANEEVTIEFPVSVNEVKMSGRMMVRGDDDFRLEDYGPIPGLEQISAVQVYARHHHAMFVGQDEQIMGLGYRACGREEGAHKLKLLERPADCSGYKRVCAGKFFRLILTNEGRLFFCGQNKKYMVGKDIEVNQMVDKFYEIVNLYPLASDEKIIDVDGGKHFMIVCTDKGRVFTSGYMMYRAVPEIRRNNEENEDFPCELKLSQPETEGWKPIRVWACDLYNNVWMQCQKGDQKKLFAAGGDYDMVGCGDGSSAPKWRVPVFPAGTYMKTLHSEGMTAYAIDQDDNVWEWGDHKVKNKDGQQPLWEKVQGFDEKRSTPYKFVWFKNNNKKPIRIASGKQWAICQVEHVADDADKGKIELYGWGGSVDARYGANPKAIYGDDFIMIGNQVNHADVVHFDCSREASYLVLQKATDELPSILSAEPEYRGLVHFFKQKGVWQYIKEEEWVMRMDKCPPLVYATRHPMKAWEQIQDNKDLIPELEEIMRNSNKAKVKAPFQNVNTTLTNEPLSSGSHLYYAKYIIDGQVKEIVSNYAEVRQGGMSFDVEPILFYVLKGPIIDHTTLPVIDNEAVFYRSENENESLRFSVINSDYNKDEVMSLQVEDEEFMDKLDQLQNFDKHADFELLRAIDKKAKSLDDNMKIKSLQNTQFSLDTLPLSSSNFILKMDSDLIKNRIELLFEFSKAVDGLLQDTFFEEHVSENSLAFKIKQTQDLLLPSVKMRFFKAVLQEFWDQRNMAISTPFRYNRKLAHDFFIQGTKQNPDFISQSTFGQLFQQCYLIDADFSMMCNTNNSFDIEYYSLLEGDNDEGNEAAFVFRKIEEELMSDQLPLFIKTPNGRHQAGTKRDCYIINPKMTNPDWMKCYQFIGALLGRVMVKDHLWFGMPLAPTFWMLAQDNEIPTLDDFAKEDARLRKRLNLFEEGKELGGSWPEGQVWEWTNCLDQTLPISKETEGKEVTRENYEDFCAALRQKLATECAEQMKHLRRGIKRALGDKDHMRQYLNWHDIMVLCETDKYKNFNELIDLFKSKTKYINCQAEDEIATWFWDIYQCLNYEDKKGYINLVSGKSRLGDVAHRYAMDHRVRVDPEMPENSVPKALPSQFEITLASSYSNKNELKNKLLEAISKGCGLEPDVI